MENYNKICQSCGMPFNGEESGTEKNGDLSLTYCKHCYQDGEFTNPALTMPGMKTTLRIEMGRRDIPSGTIEKAISILPNLNRWKNNQLV